MLRRGVWCLGLWTSSRSSSSSSICRWCLADTAVFGRKKTIPSFCSTPTQTRRRCTVSSSSPRTSAFRAGYRSSSRIAFATSEAAVGGEAVTARSVLFSTISCGIENDELQSLEDTSSTSKTMQVEPSLLARAWLDQIWAVENETNTTTSTKSSKETDSIRAAIARALPLLEDVNSVPFVCRYRTDVIYPLTTRQVFLCHNLLSKHTALGILRNKVYTALTTKTTTTTTPSTTSGDGDKSKSKPTSAAATARIDPDILNIVLTSTSKSELEELYAPFKPPSKGSILERLQKEHPQLVEYVDELWEKSCSRSNVVSSGSSSASTSSSVQMDWKRLQPHDAVVHLLSCKIAAEPKIYMTCLQELRKHCRVYTSLVKSAASSKSSSSSKLSATAVTPEEIAKYSNYQDFGGHLLLSLRDHQVLAIRRGIDAKVLQQSFDIDGDKMEGCIRYNLRETIFSKASNNAPLMANRQAVELLNEAIHDAWTRVLKRRGTTRLWKDKCQQAEERAVMVFEQNLHRALLAPPIRIPPTHVLALDPGFQAGIKCAVLDPNGHVVKLAIVKFLGQQQQRDEAVRLLEQLLLSVCQVQGNDANNNDKKSASSSVLIALGNGHGSQECRQLIQEAADQLNGGVAIEIQLVNEAGASVWSVTETAQSEFPKEQPAALAAISIGRRLQNPLFELVKVPPRSLGLGMYQHDLATKELDKILDLTSANAVATVGVDLHSCSLEILQKVPGLTLRLAQKVIEARPLLQRRQDLLQISGLGPRTFENCAAFCRITTGPEPLDATLVHPESYGLAIWLLKQFSWNLSEPPNEVPPRPEWKVKWESVLTKASVKFGVTEERVLAVLENIVDSISNVDPRLNDESSKTAASAMDSLRGCTPLPSELAESAKLQAACPVRGIAGTIRNIADFGAFIDFGGHNDGLLHTSKLGPLKLESLLIGQQIGVDVLNVMDNKVSLGLAGLNFQPDAARAGNGAKGVAGASHRGKSAIASTSSRSQTRRTNNTSSNDSKRRISSDAKRPAKKAKTNR